jgi:hypothetical protein
MGISTRPVSATTASSASISASEPSEGLSQMACFPGAERAGDGLERAGGRGEADVDDVDVVSRARRASSNSSWMSGEPTAALAAEGRRRGRGRGRR